MSTKKRLEALEEQMGEVLDTLNEPDKLFQAHENTRLALEAEKVRVDDALDMIANILTGLAVANDLSQEAIDNAEAVMAKYVGGESDKPDIFEATYQRDRATGQAPAATAQDAPDTES